MHTKKLITVMKVTTTRSSQLQCSQVLGRGLSLNAYSGQTTTAVAYIATARMLKLMTALSKENGKTEDSLAMVRKIISNEKMKHKEYTPTHHSVPRDLLYSTGLKDINMMQATNVSRILRRPGTVVRKPLVSPGLLWTNQTLAAYSPNITPQTPDLPGAGGAGEERGVDYCNGDHHKCGQHSKSHGEVFP